MLFGTWPLLGEDIAMKVETHIDVLAILYSSATPNALVIFRETGHIREALRLNSGFRLALGKAIRTGGRTAGRSAGGCHPDRGCWSRLVEFLRHRQMFSKMGQRFRSPGFEVIVVAALRVA